jgi:hypothetical protein
VICFENEFIVRQSRSEEQAEMQDAEDQGMESTRDDNEREQGLGLEAGEDGY